jgi:hypothetical protein
LVSRWFWHFGDGTNSFACLEVSSKRLVIVVGSLVRPEQGLVTRWFCRIVAWIGLS